MFSVVSSRARVNVRSGVQKKNEMTSLRAGEGATQGIKSDITGLSNLAFWYILRVFTETFWYTLGFFILRNCQVRNSCLSSVPNI